MNIYYLKPSSDEFEAIRKLEDLRAKALAAVTLLREAVEEWNDDTGREWECPDTDYEPHECADEREGFAAEMDDYQVQLEGLETELESDWPWNLTPWEPGNAAS